MQCDVLGGYPQLKNYGKDLLGNATKLCRRPLNSRIEGIPNRHEMISILTTLLILHWNQYLTYFIRPMVCEVHVEWCNVDSVCRS